MKVVVESSVPFLKGIIEKYVDPVYLDNKHITNESIRDADALIVRSVTKCTEELLAGTSVRFIATATAGVDHIDIEYCEREGIVWSNAPGCNAIAVAQYVFSCLSYLAINTSQSLRGKVIGIVGVGHVGREVERIARSIGMLPLLYDPPRAEVEGIESFSSLDELLEKSDIITLHVPLNSETKHLITKELLAKCKRTPILINACRGAVCETEALIWARSVGLIKRLVIDCWENEPDISSELVQHADLATPHIAGFSADGKHRGSRMAFLALSDFYSLGASTELLIPKELNSPKENIVLEGYDVSEQIPQAFLATLDLRDTSLDLKRNPKNFELLRKSYVYPREMSAYSVVGEHRLLSPVFKGIGFILS